ncbi:MAG: hypothetical protein NVSMB29_00830 [Candidatus Dormibacteria bacterium]
MIQGFRLTAALVAALLAALALPASALTVQLTAAPALSAGAGPLVSGTGGLVPPVQGGVISQPFGCTAYAFEPAEPACPQRHWHSGLDFAVPTGTRVVATLAGRAAVYRSAGGYGLHVVIDHGAGLTSLYGHLAEVTVPDGAMVNAGTPIGAAGSTGNSTGPHLHFEIRRDGIAEDPRLDLAPT